MTGRSPAPPTAYNAHTDREPARRRVRLGALIAVVALVAALDGGSTIQGRDAAAVAASVPTNAVTELDASGAVLASTPVGTNPIALASSGTAIWVVNAGDDTVSEIDPSTHAVTQTLDVGHDPRALVVTGDDLWVTNFSDGTVSRINVLAGRLVDTIHVGSGPDAIAAGPAGLWVANSGDNTIQRLDTTTGKPGDTVDVDDGPDGLAVDETSVWVANGRSGSVWRIDAQTGEQMNGPIRVGSGPRGIARVGEHVWVADELSQSVTRIDVATGSTHSFDVGDGPTAIAALDGAIWVAEKYSGDLVRVDAGTGEQHMVNVRAPVHGVAIAGGRVWIATGASASTSHRGGTLRVAADTLPGAYESGLEGIDPARAYDVWISHAERTVYDGLLAYHYSSADPQVLVPDLATSVPEPTDGGRTYTFNLRPGVRYSTGDVVKASDFVRGVHRALLAGHGRPDFYAGIVGGQACIGDPASCDLSRGVVADDAAGRVTFHLAAPDPEFLYRLTLLVVPTPKGTPLSRIKSPLPGTGPYQIASYSPDRRFTLARNPYFRQWSAPAQPAGFLDKIAWVRVAGDREAAESVEQGRADLAQLANGSLIERLKVTAPSRLHNNIMQATGYAVLNSSIPPFDNLRARRAFNYAFDRNKAIKHSLGLPTCQLIPPTMPSYRPYCPYTTGPPDGAYRGPDLARARDLVRASGTRGMKVTVLDVVGDFNGGEPYLATVLRQLRYQVTLRHLPYTQRNRDLFYDPGNGINVESGFFGADFPLPSNFYGGIVSCSTTVQPINHCDSALDRRAAAATAMLQTRPGFALRTWTEIDREVTDQAPLVPVANPVNWWITSDRVGNYQIGGQTIGPLLSQLWVR